VMPVVLISALFLIADIFVIQTTQAPAANATRLTVDVIGHQWWWEVRYPGTDAVTANEIHIPVGRPVNVVARTADVIHSFWVPQLNRKIDMIPGRRNRVLLYAEKPGRYRGQCAEFCGLQHAHMAMWVYADPPQRFRAWLAGQRRAAASAAASAAANGERIFMRDQCASCHTIRGTTANGKVGPDLTHVGSRTTLAALTIPNTRRALAAWMRDPQHIKPGNRMPDLGLNKTQADDVAAYLEGLK